MVDRGNKRISVAMAAVERRVLSTLSPDPTKRLGPSPRLEELTAEALLEHAHLLLSQIAGDGTAPEEVRLLAEIERLVERALKLSDEAIVNSDRKADASSAYSR